MRQIIIIFILIIITPVMIYAEYMPSDTRNFYLHTDVDELGNFNWGNFLSCLKTVKFPDDEGPRELDLKISRLVVTTINNQSWVFSVREDEKNVTLESITINTHKYYTLQEKRKLFLRIVGNCQLGQTNPVTN
jgi:hypothetical protein